MMCKVLDLIEVARIDQYESEQATEDLRRAESADPAPASPSISRPDGWGGGTLGTTVANRGRLRKLTRGSHEPFAK